MRGLPPVRQAAQTVPRIRRLPSVIDDLPRDTVASAYMFVRAHPGQVYLPYHPLITLKAERRPQHLLLNTISRQYFEALAGGTDLSASTADDEAFFESIEVTIAAGTKRAQSATTVRRGLMIAGQGSGDVLKPS